MIDFDELRELHATKRLRLVTTVRAQGYVTLGDDPDLMVRELIRLAAIGQRYEAGDIPRRIGLSSNWQDVRG